MNESEAEFKIDVNPFIVSRDIFPYATFQKKVRITSSGLFLLSTKREIFWDFIASHKTFEVAEKSLVAITDSRLPAYR